jgi:hypothetical protein
VSGSCGYAARRFAMLATDRKLSLLDEDCMLDITVDDLRRLLNLFRFVEQKMEDERYPYMDWGDLDLQLRLQERYQGILKEEGIRCL